MPDPLYYQPEAFNRPRPTVESRKFNQLGKRLTSNVATKQMFTPTPGASNALLMLLAGKQGGGGGGGRPMPGGAPVRGRGGVKGLARRIQSADDINQITNRVNAWAQRRGASLVTPQSHHDESAYERDFSFHAGTSKKEQVLLRKLYRAFTMAYGRHGQRAYTKDDHWDHLHFGTGSARSRQLQELIFGRKAIFR